MSTGMAALTGAMPNGLGDLPPSIELAWHGVNDPINLRQYLASSVLWAELDVNVDPAGQTLILRHDSFGERAAAPGEVWLELEPVLRVLKDAGRGVKLDFKVGGPWLDVALRLLEELEFTGRNVWFNGELGLLGLDWLHRIAGQWPGAVIQVPVHSLPGYGASVEDAGDAKALLRPCAEAGVNRFSISVADPNTPRLLEGMRTWGFAFNLYGITDVPSLLAAVAQNPASITADFNFPEWGYYGRGSGHGGRYWQYRLVKPDESA